MPPFPSLILEQLLSGHDDGGPVAMHPLQVIRPARRDPLRVPVRELLLRDVLGHERGIDLEDVLEAHDRHVAHALGLGRDGVVPAAVRTHLRSSSNAPSSPYLPGFMTLLGSSARLSVRITS